MACIVFVTALAIRALFCLQWEQTPYGQVALLDSAYFDQQAVAISHGQWLPDKVFYVPPVYPYLLAVTYKIFGHSLTAVRWLQNLVGSVNCLLIALIAARIFGAGTGLLAGFMAALYRPFIFYDSMILKTTWDLLFTALFLISSLRAIASRQRTDAGLSGISLGLATLLRGNMIFLVPCMPIWWLLDAWRQGKSGATAPHRAGLQDKRNLLGLVCAYGLGVALCILPVSASNYFVGNDLVLTGYSSGPNLWLGNNAEAMGVLVYPSDMATQDGNMEGEEAYFRSRAEQEEGRSLKPSEISDFWIRKAREYIVSHPLDWALLTGKKLVYFWNDHEVSDNYDMKFLNREFKTVLNGPLLSFGIVAPLAAIGVLCAFRNRNQSTRLLMGVSLVYVLSTVPFIIIDRYRLPLLVTLIPLAAHGIVSMTQEARARNKAGLAAHGLIMAAVSLLSWSPLIDTDMGLFSSYTNLGSAYLNVNNFPKAKEYYEKAMEVTPDSATALNNLAGVLLVMGEYGQAQAMSRKALALDPNYADAYANLGQIQTAMEEYDGALQSYQSALTINPSLVMVAVSLGQLYATVGDHRAAVDEYQRALALDPTIAEAYNGLGTAYHAVHEPEQAILAYQRALDLNPDFVEAYGNLGLVYYETKEFKGARRMFEQALSLRPDFAEAQEGLRLLDQEGR